jgi:hypothetical protein
MQPAGYHYAILLYCYPGFSYSPFAFIQEHGNTVQDIDRLASQVSQYFRVLLMLPPGCYGLGCRDVAEET